MTARRGALGVSREEGGGLPGGSRQGVLAAIGSLVETLGMF